MIVNTESWVGFRLVNISCFEHVAFRLNSQFVPFFVHAYCLLMSIVHQSIHSVIHCGSNKQEYYFVTGVSSSLKQRLKQLAIFRRNASKALCVFWIGFVLFFHSFDKKSAPRISRKPRITKFYTDIHNNIFFATTTPDMMSSSTSGRKL